MNKAPTVYVGHPIRCILKSSHGFMGWVLCSCGTGEQSGAQRT